MVAAVGWSGAKFGLGTPWAKNRSANRRKVSAAKYAATGLSRRVEQGCAGRGAPSVPATGFVINAN